MDCPGEAGHQGNGLGCWTAGGKTQQGCQLSALGERWSQLLLETSVNVRSKTRGRPTLELQSSEEIRTECKQGQRSCRTELRLRPRQAGNRAGQGQVCSLKSKPECQETESNSKFSVQFESQEQSKVSQKSLENCAYILPKRRPSELALSLPPDCTEPLAMMLLNSSSYS